MGENRMEIKIKVLNILMRINLFKVKLKDLISFDQIKILKGIFFVIEIFQTHQVWASDPLVLTQKDVTQLVIEKSLKAKETDFKYEQMRLAPFQKLSLYDWTFSLDSGYEKDKNEGPSHPNTLTNQTYKSNFKIKKSLLTGTLLNFEYSRNSLYGNDINLTTPKVTQYTYDLMGFSIEQNLWRNSFGVQDRSDVKAAEFTYQANTLMRASELQDLVLESLRLYWNTYVAQENFNEAIAARDRYLRFVNELKRKTSYGYSNSYELFQVQAELESREQQIKSNSLEYIKNLENLIQLLSLPSERPIQFAKIDSVPNMPELKRKDFSTLRSIHSQFIKVKAAEETLTSSQSMSHPVLSLNSSFYQSGYGERSATAESDLLSGSYPKLYVGLKFVFQFGSDASTQDILNKKSALGQEQSRYQRMTEELGNQIKNAERKIQTSYYAVESVKKQMEFREKALNQLQKSFNLGRVDINLLIDAMNKFFSAKVQHTRAVGDYFITLNEWAALNDELVVNIESGEKL